MIGSKRKVNKVLIPEKMVQDHYVGKIYGTYVESTGIFNIYDTKMLENFNDIKELGEISENEVISDKLIGIWKNDLTFTYKDTQYSIEQYSLIQNIFSRNTGILESGSMLDKIAIIVGCGSVGSLVAVELCKAGVGRFLLIDHDVLEYHNLCRHQCGLKDIGRYKAEALKDKLIDINPLVEVECSIKTIETLSKELLDRYCIESQSILIGCADNRESDVYTNSLSVFYKIPFISIGFWERAFAGEIFYYLPNKGMPCYKCALGNGASLSNRTSTSRRFYTTQEYLNKMNFEPGISVDINFVTNVGIKLILDILNLNNQKYTTRLLDSLTQYTLICNTNKTEIGGELAEYFSYPLQVTTSLEVGFSCDCPPCKYE